MGARLIVRRDAGAVRRREAKTIATVIAADMQMDLSELTPGRSAGEAATPLIGWPALRNGDLPQGRVRMAGYMMDGHRPVPDGTAVAMFMLMREAGQLLDPDAAAFAMISAQVAPAEEPDIANWFALRARGW